MATLNRSVMYSLRNTCCFTISWLNPILSLSVLYNMAKVSSKFLKEHVYSYPNGFFGLSFLVIALACFSAFLILKNSDIKNRVYYFVFSTVLPVLILGYGFYQLIEKTGGF